MTPEIALTIRIPSPGQELLEARFSCHRLYDTPDRAALLARIGAQVRGIATFASGGVDTALLDALPRTEIICHYGDGMEKIDLEAARARGIVVTNCGTGVVEDDVADTALALMLNVMRRFPQAEAFVRSGRWSGPDQFPPAASLGGKTVGILGLGRIGEGVARRAAAFGMSVRYHNRRRKDVPWAYDADVRTLAAHSDVLVIAAPGSADTERMVDATVLDALGPSGYVVNVGRGTIIDEPVLLDYLEQGRIAGAGLDVFATEPRLDARFLALDNVVPYPHAGTYTRETRDRMARIQYDNLCRFFAGEPVVNRVV
jgi:hydroxypyruvate reductase